MKESEERKFLHDIASPISSGLFIVDMLLESMKSRPDADPDELKQTKQVFDLLEKLKKMIENRREILIQQGVPSSTSKKNGIES